MLEEIFGFLDWLKVKINLRSSKAKPLFKEGEVWWCSIGINIGVEIYGKGKKFTRPVLIFKKFNEGSFLGIPLTTQIREEKWCG